MAVAQPSPRSRAPQQRLSKDDRRAQLLQAAEQVFAERGYSSTIFEEIASRAGVTRPLLYRYFRSVEELFLECHRAAREEMQERLFEAVSVAPARPYDQLRAGLGAYFAFVRDRPERFDLLYGPGAGGPLADQAAELRFATAERIAALFIAADLNIRPGAAIAHAHIVSGGAEQLAKWWQRHPEVDLESVLERMMDVCWNGLNAIHVAAQATQPDAGS